jgi:enamine deaminase RidA (YjgF/YER057c/UK114 family)
MAWRSFAAVLAVCCTILAGCPAAKNAGVGAPGETHRSTRAADAEAAARPASEPVIEYAALDAPAGTARAVKVQGFPLVHTRQLSPLDVEGQLVGEGSAEKQVEQVLTNLEAVLKSAGSDFSKLVKVNVYADSPRTADLFRAQMRQRLEAAVRPAISTVVTPLSVAGALVAADAVAASAEQEGRVALRRCEAVAGDNGCADAAVMPRGGVVYLSGWPDKSPPAEAPAKALAALLEMVADLKLQPAQVVQLKAFVDSAGAAEGILAEVKRVFPGQLAPPVVFVEWLCPAPVEIEMVVHLPLSGPEPEEVVRYQNPASVKPSPVFSRIVVVGSDRLAYISGLYARAAGSAEAQIRDVFEQLKQILPETGSDLEHLAKATYYVNDEETSKMLGRVRLDYYNPKRAPAASLAEVHGMAEADRAFTMDMIAVRP